MPELPDLQAFTKNLNRLYAGQKIEKITSPNAKKLNVSAQQLNDAIKGKKLKNISRNGKELYFDFGDAVVSLHLMLRGQLHFFEETHEQKFPIVEFYFKNGSGLVMTDFQGQARAALNPAEHDGIDALSPEVTLGFLKNKLSKSRASIKNLLLDQHFIRGIGNAYADEILWEAKISPFSISQKIPDGAIKALHKAIRSVLQAAEKQILKSNPEIISGEVRDFMKIHNSKIKESPGGVKIKIDKAGSRKTYYTDEQELYE